MACISGLVPLAVGFNINFVTMNKNLTCLSINVKEILNRKSLQIPSVESNTKCRIKSIAITRDH